MWRFGCASTSRPTDVSASATDVGFLGRVRERAAQRPRRIVLPEATDARVAEAAVLLQREGLARPLLLGEPSAVEEAVRAVGGDPGSLEHADPATDPRRDELSGHLYALRAAKGMTREQARQAVADPLVFGALLVARGHVDGSVAGAVSTTADVLRAAIRCVGLAPGIRSVSSAFYMVLAEGVLDAESSVITFTDGAVLPDPTAEQLADIAAAAADARPRIVGDDPRVAFLSYSTRGSAAGESVERVRAGLARFREMRPDVPSDGELQVDAAILPDIARRKAPDSALAGRANIFVFPDLDAGNIGYKLVQRLGRAQAIGPILQGLARPCNDLSRGASVADIVGTACVTALLAEPADRH